MLKPKITGATIPYQLRPHKAIERNLFIEILKILDTSPSIDLVEYRYVGFGAAFLEDFKLLHLQVGLIDMECVEIDKFAYSRQVFNNPYHFLKIYNLSSGDFITGPEFKQDKNQVIWLDYASPRDLSQQLVELEHLSEKTSSLDILKFTFNSELGSFLSTHGVKKATTGQGVSKVVDYATILAYLKAHSTYQLYLPTATKSSDLVKLSNVIRAMAVRSLNRGLAKKGKGLKFHHIASFSYADGQEMTTITGIVATDEEFDQILRESKLASWKFYVPTTPSTEFITSAEIIVPAMTVSERLAIDRNIPSTDIDGLAKSLGFQYGTDLNEHLELINGYHEFYKYLPYYSKVYY